MSAIKEIMVEAAERLELLGFDWEHVVIQDALAGEKPRCSDGTTLLPFISGNSYHPVVQVNDEQWERVKELEETYEIKVYHVIRTYCGDLGLVDAYLYISLPLTDYECKQDHFDISARKCPFVYLYNLTNPEHSKFGSIGVEFRRNALVRIS